MAERSDGLTLAINDLTFLDREDLRKIRAELVARGMPAVEAQLTCRAAPMLVGPAGRTVEDLLDAAAPPRAFMIDVLQAALGAVYTSRAASRSVLEPLSRRRGRPREARCCNEPQAGFGSSIAVWPSGACLSVDGRYRYALWRRRDLAQRTAAFVLLNPEAADAHEDDTTTRNCVASAARFGLGAELVALSPWRGKPKMLADIDGALRAGDVTLNEAHVRAALRRAAIVVVAIGAVPHGLRSDVVWLRNVLEQEQRRAECTWHVYCLGLTHSGLPRHPGRIFGGAMPIPYSAWPTWTLRSATHQREPDLSHPHTRSKTGAGA